MAKVCQDYEMLLTFSRPYYILEYFSVLERVSLLRAFETELPGA